MSCEVFHGNEISDCYGFWRPGLDARTVREICGTGKEFFPKLRGGGFARASDLYVNKYGGYAH